MVDLLHDKYARGLGFTKDHLHPFNLRRFSNAIAEKGSPYTNVIGFIDGTINAICRPGVNQEIDYNGHIRGHGLKFQSIVTPDGITVSMTGPFAGAMHDQRMFETSGIMDQLRQQLHHADNGDRRYTIYADPTYTANDIVVKPFRRRPGMPSEEQRVNKAMAKMRECVEWEFGHVGTFFAYIKYKNGQRVG